MPLQGTDLEIDADVGGLKKMPGAEGRVFGHGEIKDADADPAPKLDADTLEGNFAAAVLLHRRDDAVLVGCDDRVDIVESPS